MKESFWQKNSRKKYIPPVLQEDIETEVCIVGGGITGLTTAINLLDAGKSVVVLEALEIGAGTTGLSSCHLNTQVDFSYSAIHKNFGEETAKIVASSRAAAIDNIEQMVNNYQIDCEFRRVHGYLYTEEQEKIEEIEAEYKNSSLAGLPVEITNEMDYPVPVAKAIVYQNQAIINSQEYLNGLVERSLSVPGL